MHKKSRRILLALGWYDYRLHRGIARFAEEHRWHLCPDTTKEKVVPWGWEGDGYTARFIAASNTNGLANFTFTATDPATITSFGPVSYGVLIITNAMPVTNTVPTLAAISNYAIIAGATLTFTNSASDTDLPAQALTFALLDNPGGASVTANGGVFNWRPTVAQGGSSNAMRMVVTDSGSPSLSATQVFRVLVNAPVNPTLQSGGVSNGQFSFLVTGNAGPDYLVQTSTNLVIWSDATNFASPGLPLNWSDPNPMSFKQRFYRVLLGP